MVIIIKFKLTVVAAAAAAAAVVVLFVGESRINLALLRGVQIRSKTYFFCITVSTDGAMRY